MKKKLDAECSEFSMMEVFFQQLDEEADAVRQVAIQEYASKEEPYLNFVTRAEFLELSVRDVILSDLMKHVISICRGVSLREPMRGRMIDTLNLLRLLAYWDDAQPPLLTLEEEEAGLADIEL